MVHYLNSQCSVDWTELHSQVPHLHQALVLVDGVLALLVGVPHLLEGVSNLLAGLGLVNIVNSSSSCISLVSILVGKVVVAGEPPHICSHSSK